MTRKKFPIAALFVAAALIAGAALATRDDSPAVDTVSLPDPELMLANSTGYEPLDEIADGWRQRVLDHPADTLNRTQYGRTLIALARETGDLAVYEQAEAQLRRAVAAAPGDPGAATAYAASLSAQHEFHAALEVLTAAAARTPDNPGIGVAIADTQLELGRYQDAFDGFDRLTRRSPNTAATLSRQARVAALTGRNDEAVELARRSLVATAGIGVRAGDAAGSWFQLAHFQFQAGQVDEAEASLRSALAIDPDHGGSSELLAHVLVSQGDLDAAAELYEQLVEDAGAADLYGALADVYELQGRDDEAAALVRTGLALADEQVAAFPAERRHMAGFFADHADPERFLELMEIDITTRRDIGGLDLLAWAHHLTGDDQAALRVMDEALALGTRDAGLLFHAGMIEASAGDTDAARRHLEAALEVNPRWDPTDAETARATLDDLS